MAEYSFCTEGMLSTWWHIRERGKPKALCGCAVQHDVAAEFTDANLNVAAHGYHICDACREVYFSIR